jgi:DNA-binding MarR family transcriptional regulator
MGANRQNVQRIVNDLQAMEFITFETNPRHRRAQLVALTDQGKQAYDSAMALQAPWVNKLSKGIPPEDLANFQRVLLLLRERLEGDELAGRE